MNLAASAPTWLYGLLLACLAAGAIEDALRLRISNMTCLLIAVLAIVAAALAGPTPGLWQNLASFLLVLVLGTSAFSKGWVGGGDVKFLSAVALWFPLKSAFALLAAVFLAGGLLALSSMLLWQIRRTGQGSSKTRQIAYGLAIAAGSIVVLHSSRLP